MVVFLSLYNNKKIGKGHFMVGHDLQALPSLASYLHQWALTCRNKDLLPLDEPDIIFAIKIGIFSMKNLCFQFKLYQNLSALIACLITNTSESWEMGSETWKWGSKLKTFFLLLQWAGVSCTHLFRREADEKILTD